MGGGKAGEERRGYPLRAQRVVKKLAAFCCLIPIPVRSLVWGVRLAR
jgi:hypothetical protein